MGAPGCPIFRTQERVAGVVSICSFHTRYHILLLPRNPLPQTFEYDALERVRVSGRRKLTRVCLVDDINSESSDLCIISIVYVIVG
jgi:hypothetical protein